jgi:hypothetical protein
MRPIAPELTKPLTDPAFYSGEPFPLYARLRREAPRAWNEEPGLWVLSTYDDSTEPGTAFDVVDELAVRLESAGVVAGIVHADLVLS